MSQKILIVCRALPTEIGNSESIRLFRIIRMLSEKYNIYVSAEKAIYGVNSIKSLGVQFYLNHDISTNFTEIIETINPDLVIFSRWLMAKELIDIVKETSFAKIAIDIPNITFEQLEQTKQFDDEKIQEYKKQEIEIYNKVDFLITTTKRNKAILSKYTKKEINIIYPIYIFDEFKRVLRNINFKTLYFVGDFTFNSNNISLKWLATDLWPYTKTILQDLELNIFGKFIDINEFDFEKYQINYHGFVNDLDSYIDEIAICLAPIKITSGINGKILEAISKCIPVVTTKNAAKCFEELGLIPEKHFFIADNKKEFAEKINEIIIDYETALNKTYEAKQILSKSLSCAKIKLNLFDLIKEKAIKNSYINEDDDIFEE